MNLTSRDIARVNFEVDIRYALDVYCICLIIMFSLLTIIGIYSDHWAWENTVVYMLEPKGLVVIVSVLLFSKQSSDVMLTVCTCEFKKKKEKKSWTCQNGWRHFKMILWHSGAVNTSDSTHNAGFLGDLSLRTYWFLQYSGNVRGNKLMFCSSCHRGPWGENK